MTKHTHTLVFQTVCPKQKMPAASLKHSKHGLGLPIHKSIYIYIYIHHIENIYIYIYVYIYIYILPTSSCLFCECNIIPVVPLGWAFGVVPQALCVPPKPRGPPYGACHWPVPVRGPGEGGGRITFRQLEDLEMALPPERYMFLQTP